MRARDIMTANPRTVNATDTVRRAAAIIREAGVGALPVVTNGTNRILRGIITDRDIATRCTAEGHSPHCLVRDHMTAAPLQTVDPDEHIDNVLDKMEAAQVRRIPVVTTDGAVAGIIAQADIAKKYGHQHPREIEELLVRVSTPVVRA